MLKDDNLITIQSGEILARYRPPLDDHPLQQNLIFHHPLKVLLCHSGGDPRLLQVWELIGIKIRRHLKGTRI